MTTSYGCDSIINTLLIVIPSASLNQQINICEGASFQVGNNIYNTSGIYIDTIQLLNSCDSIISTTIDVSYIDVVINWSNNLLTGDVIMGIANSYLWSTGETTQTISPMASGVYWLIVSDINNCNSDTVLYNYSSTDIFNELNNSITIFPNPTDGLVTISVEGIENGDFRISILNVLSEVIFEEKLMQFSGFYQKKINLDNFAKSVYLIRIETSESTINKKLILR